MQPEIIKPGYRRVTEILSPQTGYGNVPPKILQNACDRGTRVHKAIANYLLGLGMWHEEPEDIPYLESFEKFWQDYNFTALEERFYCDDLMLTGACDVIIQQECGPVMLDWKTSYSVNPTWAYQGAAYKYLAKDYDVQEIWFVHLNKKGDAPKVIKYGVDDCAKNLQVFMKCLDVYEIFHAKKKIQHFEEL